MRVIEGHQLQGNNIKPVVTISIGQHRFRTRIRVGNNPYYNEVTLGRGHRDVLLSPRSTLTPFLPVFQVFCQSFHQTPEQLVMEPIRIQVRDEIGGIKGDGDIGVALMPCPRSCHRCWTPKPSAPKPSSASSR